MDSIIGTIDGKYSVVRPLGGGGFSEVYLVEGPQGPCALKLLKGNIQSLNKSALEEFKHEFEILKDMRHPHIASILDFGFDDANERYYYTSELIDGRDLLTATKGIPLQAITELIVQALRALSYLHSFRIYHFDIKAANLLVVDGKEPYLKIIDFGLAGIDPRGRLIGTPSYMAPEIVAREHADGRADLYSLGVLWYAALTRKNPFRTSQSRETLSRQLHHVPNPPSQEVSTIPQWLDAIIMRLLEKNPADRFASASAVIREINRLSKSSYPLETRETLLSYIPDEGRFVGRAEEIEALEADILKMRELSGESDGCLVMGALGTGKTRLLKEIKYRTQLKDVRVQFASATEGEAFDFCCEELSQHISEGKGLYAFIFDDVQIAMQDEVMRARLLPLISKARRPVAASSVWIGLALRPEMEEELFGTLKALLPRHVEVGAFSHEELCAYIVSLTGLERPPDSLLEGLFERTEGNPLFVTEMIKSLIEGGALFDERGRWKAGIFEDVGVDFSKAAVPMTVGQLLLERTEKLSSHARELLEALAVSQRAATSAELEAWTRIPEIRSDIVELMRQGILDRGEGFSVRFHNALLSQVLLERLPSGRAAKLHDAIARELMVVSGEVDEVLDHRSQGSDRHGAYDAAMRLGEKALKLGRGEHAARYLERARALVEHAAVEKRVEVEMKLGEAYLISHDYTAATDLFSSVESLIASCSDSPMMGRWRAEALTRIGGTYIKLQEFERARAAFHDARSALTVSGGDRWRELIIENFLGTIQYLEGHLEEARKIFVTTRQSPQTVLAQAEGKVTNNDLGMVLVALGQLEEARKVLEEDLEVAQEIHDDLLIGRAHYNLAQLCSAERHYENAIASYKSCVEVCRQSHNTELLLRAYNGLGNAFQVIGDYDQSLAYYQRGMDLHEREGDLRGGAAIAVNMGIVESSRSRNDRALGHIVPAVDFLRSLPVKTAMDWVALSRGLLEMGDLDRKEGRFDRARQHLDEAKLIASKVPQAHAQRFWILATLAEVAEAEGQEEEVRDLLDVLEPLAQSRSEMNTIDALKVQCGLKPPPQDAKPPEGGEKDAAQPSAHEAEGASHEAPATGEAPAGRAIHAEEASSYHRILEINKLIVGQRDLQVVLKTVLLAAIDLTGAQVGAVLLVEGDGAIVPMHQINMEHREDEVAFSRTLAEQVVRENRPIVTDDALSDDRYAEETSVCAYHLRSLLCLPVRGREGVVGAFYLENHEHAGAFASANMQLLDAFSDQVGLAIEASRMLTHSQRTCEHLEQELEEVSRRAVHYEELLKQQPQTFKFNYGGIASRSPPMQRILRVMDKIADTDLSIFICGESGTGKELIARALHGNHATRCARRFVAINCGAIPHTLIESELFGYKAGAFTGADRDKGGLIQEADGGTLFLDEIGEIPPALQVKLLRVLQEREYTRIGETKPVPVNIRLLTASNRDIEGMVSEGSFRKDLYYRICQIKLEVPPLRKRPEDIPTLVQHFIAEAAPDRKLSVSPRLMRRLLAYAWPGNVRELLNLMQVCCALAEGELIDERTIPENHPLAQQAVTSQRGEPGHISERAWPASSEDAAVGEAVQSGGISIDGVNTYDPRKSWEDYECLIIAKCYEANAWQAKVTARELGIALTTLYSRIKQYALGNHDQAVYQDSFRYERGMTIKQYLPLIFDAALRSAGSRAKDAIANLRVSQAYFYKVMKRRKQAGA